MKKYGFPKALRLLTPAEFQAVFLQPIRSSSRYFTVLAKPNALPFGRLGIIVAKRNAKRAVDRNRIRRLIREQFRLNQNGLLGLDIIVLARCNITLTVQNEAKQKLKEQWTEIVHKRR